MTNTQTTKHTPGKWTSIKTYNNGKFTNAIAAGENLTHLIYFESGRGLGHQTDANINLMCAAPDMLGALKEANLTLSRLYEGRDGGEMPAVVNLVRAAISAAEGK